MEFGNRLRKLRNQNGLSQKEVAIAISVSVNAISQYETNKRFPEPDVLVHLCKYYKISADYLLGLTEQQRSPQTTGEVLENTLSREQHVILDELIKMLNKEENIDGKHKDI